MEAIITSIIAGSFTLIAAWISRQKPEDKSRSAGTQQSNFSESNQNNDSAQKQTAAYYVKQSTSVSFYLGLVSFIAWFIPLFGFPVALIGVGIGLRDIVNPSKKMVRFGIWLNVLGLIATSFNSALGLYQGLGGSTYY